MLPPQFLALAALAGCVNPNAIGVQDFGYIQGRVLNARTNQPITGTPGSLPLVSATGYAANVDASGAFVLRVPIGPQTFYVSAPGFTAAGSPCANQYCQTVSVLKDQYTTNIGQNGDGYVYLTPVNP